MCSYCVSFVGAYRNRIKQVPPISFSPNTADYVPNGFTTLSVSISFMTNAVPYSCVLLLLPLQDIMDFPSHRTFSIAVISILYKSSSCIIKSAAFGLYQPKMFHVSNLMFHRFGHCLFTLCPLWSTLLLYPDLGQAVLFDVDFDFISAKLGNLEVLLYVAQ